MGTFENLGGLAPRFLRPCPADCKVFGFFRLTYEANKTSMKDSLKMLQLVNSEKNYFSFLPLVINVDYLITLLII
jgi:hypothetical protein